jgi:hypothetical protein
LRLAYARGLKEQSEVGKENNSAQQG